MKAYLFVFDNAQIAREIVIKRLDKMSKVLNWYAFFENTLCLASYDDAKTISRMVREAFPDLRFIITEVDPEKRGGRLPRSVWSFLDEPQPADVSTEDA
jgi:hypothetical protein